VWLREFRRDQTAIREEVWLFPNCSSQTTAACSKSSKRSKVNSKKAIGVADRLDNVPRLIEHVDFRTAREADQTH
jgi:hypothetical protein